jgi:hypothetical protein
MYSPNLNKIGSSYNSLSDFIENGNDVYNSKLIKYVVRLPVISQYQVNRFEYRIDLISKELFNDDYTGDLLLIYNNISASDLKLGKVLNVFDLTQLTRLIHILNDLP